MGVLRQAARLLARRWRHARGFVAAARVAALLLLGLSACRGGRSSSPPVHLQQNMASQARFGAQQSNAFFADGRAMRTPPANTIAHGALRESEHLYRGTLDGKPADRLPVALTADLLQRGRERFDIYCQPCHGASGNGESILRARKMAVPAPSYHEQRLLQAPIGHFFGVISEGVRSMPSYAWAIPVTDRWAIAAYVRALQLAGHATLDQLPPDVVVRRGWRTP
ncbi:MAG: cytochrome c [Proteobacteria bacterium]|nr:cytochrome c [Pseudomonadota bacterium]